MNQQENQILTALESLLFARKNAIKLYSLNGLVLLGRTFLVLISFGATWSYARSGHSHGRVISQNTIRLAAADMQLGRAPTSPLFTVEAKDCILFMNTLFGIMGKKYCLAMNPGTLFFITDRTDYPEDMGNVTPSVILWKLW